MAIKPSLPLALFLALAVLPLLLGLGYALAYSLGIIGYGAEGLTLAHWRAVLGSAYFWRTLAFSFYIALVTISLAVGVAMALAVAWPRAFRRGSLSLFIYFPLAIPAIVMAFFIFQLLSGGGLVSRLSWQAGLISGLEQFPGLVNDRWGIGIILAHFLMAAPFFTILFARLYASERAEALVLLARTLGAGPRQAAFRVVVPVLLRRVFPTIVLYGLFVMGAYEAPLLLGRQTSQMVSVLAVQKLQRFNLGDIPQAYVICLAYAAIVLTLAAWLLGRERARG
ncbi:MAG: ABC transporter permease subunit [Phaeodactylibacter sp.]|nr:ABC transporter permease subunit [Phaeodactylibacter sp.]MCB9275515.1 ABC transporter permease subunit [Lewinellaceae bacterium]